MTSLNCVALPGCAQVGAKVILLHMQLEGLEAMIIFINVSRDLTFKNLSVSLNPLEEYIDLKRSP